MHTSPFKSREKSDSDIVNLSWPKGSAINDAVNPDTYVVDFVLTPPTIDHITKAVKAFGRGCYMAKIDVSRALKHIPIDPKDIHHLGLHWGPN